MTTSTVANALARYVAEERFAKLPDDVVSMAKVCLIDFLGSTLASDVTGDTTACVGALVRPSDRQEARIYGTELLSSVETASFINSARSASVICTDTFISSSCHPGQSILPPVLAIAERDEKTGPEIIEAMVVGYEIMARLGDALIIPDLAKVFRPTGLLAPTSAAAALSRLLNLTRDESLYAISQATNAAGGFNAWAETGSAEVLFHSSHAAKSALTAVELARAGIRFAPSVLEGDAGLLAAFGRKDHATELVSNPGDSYGILKTVFKPAPTCIYTQDACRLAAKIGAEHHFEFEEVDWVEIHVTEAAAKYPGCDNAGPFSDLLPARMSLQLSVVSLLRAAEIRPDFATDFEAPEVAKVASRSRVLIDPKLEAASSERMGTKVVVHLHDGNIIEAELDDFRSMTISEVENRFLSNATEALNASAASALLEMINSFDTLENTGRFFELLGVNK